MNRTTSVLIAAYSGRALAASASRGGYAPLVADFFGDEDTLASARAHVRLRASLEQGFDADELDAAFRTLANGSEPLGFVCGTGFEDRTEVIARMTARWPLIGNRPNVVSRVKDPESFAALCRRCGVAHPETRLLVPDDPSGWFVKRVGGAGGTHIAEAEAASTPKEGWYYQRRVAGRPVSALVLADGHEAMILGFSIQWAAPTKRHPFRFGGAAGPAPIAPATAAAMMVAIQRLVAELGLVGLNSFDFLLDGASFHLLEVNPRPGATLDIFEPAAGSLFELHVAACQGRLPKKPPVPVGAKACAILYAPAAIAAVPARDWPDWIADRPAAGSPVPAQAPICTVTATASSAAAARRRVAQRSARLLAELSGGPS
jgi:uncharacterized protein